MFLAVCGDLLLGELGVSFLGGGLGRDARGSGSLDGAVGNIVRVGGRLLAFFAARFFADFLAAASDSPSATAAARRSCATSSVDLRFFPAAGSFGCSTAATASAGSRPSASAALNAAARRALASAAAFCLAAFFNFLTS